MVIAERRSPWADLLFLTEEDRTMKTQLSQKLTWLESAVLSYSPNANAGLDWFSVFHLRLLLGKNLFDGVCILEHMSRSIVCMENIANDIEYVSHSRCQTHLENLGSRLVVSFGIPDQQVYIFSHGTNTPVVSQLKGKYMYLYSFIHKYNLFRFFRMPQGEQYT